MCRYQHRSSGRWCDRSQETSVRYLGQCCKCRQPDGLNRGAGPDPGDPGNVPDPPIQRLSPLLPRHHQGEGQRRDGNIFPEWILDCSRHTLQCRHSQSRVAQQSVLRRYRVIWCYLLYVFSSAYESLCFPPTMVLSHVGDVNIFVYI